jgi:hypothetical protein
LPENFFSSHFPKWDRYPATSEEKIFKNKAGFIKKVTDLLSSRSEDKYNK